MSGGPAGVRRKPRGEVSKCAPVCRGWRGRAGDSSRDPLCQSWGDWSGFASCKPEIRDFASNSAHRAFALHLVSFCLSPVYRAGQVLESSLLSKRRPGPQSSRPVRHPLQPRPAQHHQHCSILFNIIFWASSADGSADGGT
jgi:hypothetical protein